MSDPAIDELKQRLLDSFSNANIGYYFIDGDKINDKATFLKEFALKFNFPDSFGFNWDAFSDCMTDLSWCDNSGGFLIVYKNFYNFRRNYLEEWLFANEILLDAADYWQLQSKPMTLIFL